MSGSDNYRVNFSFKGQSVALSVDHDAIVAKLGALLDLPALAFVRRTIP